MGQLLSLAGIKANLGAHWYFTSEVKLPNAEYPHTLFILCEKLTNQARVEIRKFVQSSCEDTVIVETFRRTYRSYTNMTGHRWDWYDREINWSYECFYFQTEEEALLFKLRFSELVSEFTDYDLEHPPSHIQESEREIKELEKSTAKALSELYENTNDKDNKQIQPLTQEIIDHLVETAARWREDDPILFVDEEGTKFTHSRLERYIRMLYRLRKEQERFEGFRTKPFRTGNPY